MTNRVFSAFLIYCPIGTWRHILHSHRVNRCSHSKLAFVRSKLYSHLCALLLSFPGPACTPQLALLKSRRELFLGAWRSLCFSSGPLFPLLSFPPSVVICHGSKLSHSVTITVFLICSSFWKNDFICPFKNLCA